MMVVMDCSIWMLVLAAEAMAKLEAIPLLGEAATVAPALITHPFSARPTALLDGLAAEAVAAAYTSPLAQKGPEALEAARMAPTPMLIRIALRRILAAERVAHATTAHREKAARALS